MRIFISNLNVMTTSRHLTNLFFEFGRVISAKVVSDDNTGLSLGYGFVEMDRRTGEKAIRKLDSLYFMARHLFIKEAMPV